MSRYIDADKLVSVMCHHCTEYEQCTDKNGGCYDFDMLMIAHAPTADVVEVVRCKDCNNNGYAERCPMYNGWYGVHDDDFCSYGERKDGAE